MILTTLVIMCVQRYSQQRICVDRILCMHLFWWREASIVLVDLIHRLAIDTLKKGKGPGLSRESLVCLTHANNSN